MAKNRLEPTTELLDEILARIPEGVIRKKRLHKKVRYDKEIFNQAAADGILGFLATYYFDARRLNPTIAERRAEVSDPRFPRMSKRNREFNTPRIDEQIEAQNSGLDDTVLDFLEHFPPIGFAFVDDIADTEQAQRLVSTLCKNHVLGRIGDIIFDPMQISTDTARKLNQNLRVNAIYEALTAYLEEKPAYAETLNTLHEKFGRKEVQAVLSKGGFRTFAIKIRQVPYSSTWVSLKKGDFAEAEAVARETMSISDDAWDECLEITGDMLRPEAREGKKSRTKVIARSYTINNAAKRLGAKPYTIEQALQYDAIPYFVDPEGRIRIPVFEVEAAYNDPDYADQFIGRQAVKAPEISIVSGLNYNQVRYRLKKAGISRTNPRWAQVRGRWDLPEHLHEFRMILREKRKEAREQRREAQREEDRIWREQRAIEEQRNEALRSQLVAAFPTWRHDRRNEQHIYLHIGPPQ